MKDSLDVENGNFTRIHNRALEELIKVKLSDHEWRVIVLIWRLTYGWQKKEKYITNKTLQEKTGLSDVAICRALKKLKDRNLIIKDDNKNPPTTRFNKYFTTWKQLSKKITLIKNDNKQLSKKITPIINNDNDKSPKNRLGVKQRAPKEISTKERFKERTTIMSQIHNIIMQFPDNIKPLVFEYTDIMRLQNKTCTLSKHKELRLINELYLLWQQYNTDNDTDKSDYQKALKITINNQAPNINYVRKVIKNIVNKRSMRIKKGTISS